MTIQVRLLDEWDAEAPSGDYQDVVDDLRSDGVECRLEEGEGQTLSGGKFVIESATLLFIVKIAAPPIIGALTKYLLDRAGRKVTITDGHRKIIIEGGDRATVSREVAEFLHASDKT